MAGAASMWCAAIGHTDRESGSRRLYGCRCVTRVSRDVDGRTQRLRVWAIHKHGECAAVSFVYVVDYDVEQTRCAFLCLGMC
jgi:hypothetical protein